MEFDRRLFGDGPYPLRGPWAILARVAFLGAVTAILIAVFLPEDMVPQFVRSHYLQHFAAFYVVTLFALTAAPRSRLRAVGMAMVAFATGLELAHLLAGARFKPLVDNWEADIGGVIAALGPALAERFRARFRQPSSPQDTTPSN